MTQTTGPEGGCANYAKCGNMTPLGTESGNQMCDTCLDAARSAGRGHDL